MSRYTKEYRPHRHHGRNISWIERWLITIPALNSTRPSEIEIKQDIQCQLAYLPEQTCEVHKPEYTLGNALDLHTGILFVYADCVINNHRFAIVADVVSGLMFNSVACTSIRVNDRPTMYAIVPRQSQPSD